MKLHDTVDSFSHLDSRSGREWQVAGFLPHFFLEIGGNVGPKGDQGVHLLRQVSSTHHTELDSRSSREWQGGFDLRGSSRFLPHFFLEIGGSVGPKGDQGVHLLRQVGFTHHTELDSRSGREWQGGGCGIRTGELVRLGEDVVKVNHLYVLL